MSNTSIQLKKSGATGNTPTGLAFGEVAINYADGKLYYKNALGGTSYISNQFSFDTINANNSLILATGVSDTLSFVAGNNISISTNTTTKTITINSTGTATDQFARDVANSGYTQANTATNNAAGASLYANGAFAQANAAFNKANTYPGNPNQILYKNSSNVLTSSSGLVYDGVSIKVNGNLESTFQNGDEGGEIFLNKSVTNTTLSSGVSIDVYQNRLRIFETGGSNRGVYIDMANGAASGIGTNLLSPPGGSVTSVAGATGTVSNTQLIAGIQTVSSSYGITFDYVATANNGQGTNFKVGDDAWIGDYNTADSLKIKGQQNAANGYVSFGSNTSQLGAAGSGQLTYGGNIVWHAGNDGAGSGLDADLLDGLNGSDFARVSAESYANSAYTQANTATTNAATADSKAVTAGSYANSSFGVANSAALYANAAFIQANAAFIKANSIPSSANTANSANIAGVAVNARITNVTTGTYYPIVTDTTITGSDTFHYSSNDFLMYAANNTFKASGNVWAGQFLAVGTNIPVVNSTGHWVGQTVNGIDSFARSTANSAALYANGAFIQANAAFNRANSISNISNGTSNVNIATANGNVLVSVAGTANIASFSNVGLSVGLGSLSRSPNVGAASPLYVVSNINSTAPPISIQNRFANGYSSLDMHNSSNVFMGAVGAANPGTTLLNNRVYLYSDTAASGLGLYATTGNVTISVLGNTVATVTNTGVILSGTNLTGANNIYAGTIIANSTLSIAGSGGDITGANNIFAGVINVTTASIVAGFNVIPYIQSAFTQANAAYAQANTGGGGGGSGNASFIFSGTSNVFFATANGNIVANVGGNTIATVTNTGIQMAGLEGDISGANNVYANTFIANTALSIAGSGGNIRGANNIFANVINVTTASIVAGVNVVPYIQSAFDKANTAGAASFIFNGTSNVFFATANGNIVANVGGNTIATVTNTGIQMAGLEGDISGANNVYANTFIANAAISISGSGGNIRGANNIFANVINVTTSSIVAGVNVVPFIQSAFTQANTGVNNAAGASLYANGAFVQANAGYTQANTATNNAAGASLYANGAFVQANAGYTQANTATNNAAGASLYANGSFIQANAAFLVANTPTHVANSAALYANAAFIQANAAFAAANSGGGGGGAGTDNVARQTANAAFIQANAAFAKANVGGGGSDLLVYTNLYTANGNTTTFSLSTTPQNIDYTIVNINGVIQLKNTYSLSGNTVVLSEVVPVNTTIEITVFGGGSVSEYYNRSYTGDNTTTTFAVTSGVTSNSIIVTENGIIQQPGVDYYVSGSNVIFTTAPSSTISIGIRELSRGVSNGSSANVEVGFVTQNKTNIDSNVTIGAGYSGVSVGPLSIANNVVISIAAGQKWVIL